MPRATRRRLGGDAQASRDEVHGVAHRLDAGRLLLGDADPVGVLELHHQLVQIEGIGVEVLAHAGGLGDLVQWDLELARQVLAHLLENVGAAQGCGHYDTFLSRMLPRVMPERSRSWAVRSTARSSTPCAASRMALAIPSGPELPWPTTASPRRPSRIAPPVVSGSIWLRSVPSAGRSSRPPAAPRGPGRAAAPTASATALAVPSIVFSTTLPVKPSVTTTSASPVIRSRPSMFPRKSIPPASPRRAFASTTSAEPLLCSSPTESNPILGRSTSRTAVLKADPRYANWTRSTARASELAPTSRSNTGRSVRPGTSSRTASAGRRTPCIRRSANSAAVIVAPVGPALTSAAERPSATSAAARTTEAPGRDRTAATGSSEFVISSSAATSSTPSRFRTSARVSGSPNTRSLMPSAVAARAPANTDWVPRSAPRPSRATVTAKRYSSVPAADSRGAASAISCSITSRPAYVPQTGHTRCGKRGLWHRGHALSRGALILWVARRLSRRVREVLFFGTAMKLRMLAAPLAGHWSSFISRNFAHRGSGADSWRCSAGSASLKDTPHTGHSPLQSGRQRS